MKAVIYRKDENKLILAAKSIVLFEFDQSFDPSVTDDK
jgi:hypothetical protein